MWCVCVYTICVLFKLGLCPDPFLYRLNLKLHYIYIYFIVLNKEFYALSEVFPVVWYLKAITHIYNIIEGVLAWQSAGHPTLGFGLGQ